MESLYNTRLDTKEHFNIFNSSLHIYPPRCKPPMYMEKPYTKDNFSPEVRKQIELYGTKFRKLCTLAGQYDLNNPRERLRFMATYGTYNKDGSLVFDISSFHIDS